MDNFKEINNTASILNLVKPLTKCFIMNYDTDYLNEENLEVPRAIMVNDDATDGINVALINVPVGENEEIIFTQLKLKSGIIYPLRIRMISSDSPSLPQFIGFV